MNMEDGSVEEGYGTSCNNFFENVFKAWVRIIKVQFYREKF